MIVTLCLAGCGGLPAGSGGAVDKATVVVTIGPAGTQDPLEVEATVICGGVRGTYKPGDGWVTLNNVPLGTQTPPQQPLTVTARGYRTEAQWLVLNTTAATYADVGLTKVDLKQTGTVQGQITDRQTGVGIVNSNVQFLQETTSQQDEQETRIVQGFTDSEGHYIIAGIPIGRTIVKVGAAGYLENTASITVEPDDGGQNSALDLTLISGEAKVEVRGAVLDLATQRPIAGAQVKLDENLSAVTGTDGSFWLADVKVGQREIVVTAEGYDEYRETISVAPGMGTLRIEMIESAPTPPPPPHNVAGTVSVRNRSDSRGVKVSAYNLRVGQVMDEYTTKADGRYYLLVPPGDYEIRAEFEGQQLIRQLTVLGGGRVVSDVDFVISAPPE